MPCRLCGIPSILKESHIIPSFVFRWLMSSGTGRLRNLAKVNVPVQDGPKKSMLCLRCEQLFGNYEKYFSENIFRPYIEKEQVVFTYTNMLYKFVASVFWRLLEDGLIVDEGCSAAAVSTKELLKQCCRADTVEREELSIHMLASVDPFQHDKTITIPTGAIHYLARGVDASVLNSKEKLYLYLKLPRFIFILPIKGMNSSEYHETQISTQGGVVDVTKARIEDKDFADFMWETFEYLGGIKSSMSENQKTISLKRGQEYWSEIKNNDLGIILEHQVRREFRK